MKQTYSISVVLDDEDPIEKQREDARVAARGFFDLITGGATGFLISAATAHSLGDENGADKLMADYKAAKLCPE